MKKIILYLAMWPVFFFWGCAAQKGAMINKGKAIDREAHRGGRGLMPENTIVAMKNAIDLDVTTLELDVHITKDKQVVVSHDPFFNEVITTKPDGTFISKKEAQNYLLYTMTYDSIRKYDVGLKPHPDFPLQKKLPAYKPLLTELLDSCEAYAKTKGRKMRYNIEIKSVQGMDDIRHPAPAPFAELLLAVLKNKKVLDRTVIQSFDERPLQYIHQKYPKLATSFLAEKDGDKLDQQLATLGFSPDTYSPQYRFVSKELVDACHAKGIKILPWTVNTKEAVQKLIADGVDGIISDYPDLFTQLARNK